MHMLTVFSQNAPLFLLMHIKRHFRPWLYDNPKEIKLRVSVSIMHVKKIPLLSKLLLLISETNQTVLQTKIVITNKWLLKINSAKRPIFDVHLDNVLLIHASINTSSTLKSIVLFFFFLMKGEPVPFEVPNPELLFV